MEYIQYLIQGGAVGISFILIWVVYKLATNHDKHMLDALDRNTSAWNENTKALQKLADVIEMKK